MPSITHKHPVAYAAPDGMTPALARYIHIGGYDTRTFAVAILDLVAGGFLRMETGPGGVLRLSRGAVDGRTGGKPASLPSRQLLRDILRGRDGMAINKAAYIDLLRIRKRHARAMDWQDQTMQGTGGGTLMLGVLIGAICLILVMREAMLRPYGMPALEAIWPLWPVPVLSYGALYLWRRHARRNRRSVEGLEKDVAAYRHYLEVAMADRLNPRFMADGRYKSYDPELVYAAAFGFDNAWADPLVHRLENLLPGPVRGTHLYDGVDGSDLPDKRGFAPRPQPGSVMPLFFMGGWFGL